MYRAHRREGMTSIIGRLLIDYWPVVCAKCGGCYSPQCPLGGEHQPGCVGLLSSITLDGVTYCGDCALVDGWRCEESSGGQRASRDPT